MKKRVMGVFLFDRGLNPIENTESHVIKIGFLNHPGTIGPIPQVEVTRFFIEHIPQLRANDIISAAPVTRSSTKESHHSPAGNVRSLYQYIC